MQLELLTKLDKALNENIVNEYQVVYILSRIRKYLELERSIDGFIDLFFFCNWALHADINRKISELLIKKLKDILYKGKFVEADVLFESFFLDLKKFIALFKLPDKILQTENKIALSNYLIEIYSDTPLIIKTEDLKVSLKSSKRFPDDEIDMNRYLFTIDFETISKPN